MSFTDWQRDLDDRHSCDWRWQRADPARKGQLLRTPFSDEMREMGDSYGVQCVLIAQLDFGIWGAASRGEWAMSVYSDRMPHEELREIVIRHGGRGSIDFTRSASKPTIKNFVADVCRANGIVNPEGLSGLRIMRHTNVSSGYPIYTIEAHGKPPASLKEENAPEVKP